MCFVITPFGGWHDAYYEEIFRPGITAAGLEPRRADSLFRSSNIVHDIWSLVSTARVMLADLTGKNPNVFYELGLGHAARKPILLLTQDIEDVPFDLRALRVIPYDTQHPTWGARLQENIEKGLRETLESPETAVLPTFLREEPASQPLVSAEEHRLLELEQQLRSLRAEVRSVTSTASTMGPSITSRGIIPRAEAGALIRNLLLQGISPHVIDELVTARGAPDVWVEKEIRTAQQELANEGKASMPEFSSPEES